MASVNLASFHTKETLEANYKCLQKVVVYVGSIWEIKHCLVQPLPPPPPQKKKKEW